MDILDDMGVSKSSASFFFSKVTYSFEGILHFFLEICSFYNSPKVTVFKPIQPIFRYLEDYQ